MAKVLHVAAMLICISLINIRRASGSPFEPTKMSTVDEVGEHHHHLPKMEDVNSAEENPEEDLSALLSNTENHDDTGYDEEEEETECPPGQWFHIRGNRCVPHKCIGGNRFRDMVTGECLISKGYGQGFVNSGGERSLSRYNPRMQGHGRGMKGRLRFGLPAKLKG